MSQQNTGSTIVNSKPKKTAVETFMGGAKKGFYIGIEQILPAMIMGYVIVQFLQLTGLVDILGNVFGPVMGIFGLPGESVVVLISAFFAKAAGAATAANLFAQGIITASQATILIMPCMLMGTLVGHYARIVLVANTSTKYRMLLLAVPIFDAVVGMLIVRVLLTFMGVM
ncbi:YjiG family protein [Clostridioides sp. ZZV15-6388]|uniref:YjiG family protein n=1 Tax=unclassified Clostridioides TaxID=2635829 RepID=UPI001D12DE12|nr:YjiG family protein [Clostridioides sp. ZZV15-6388]MCC0664924.1 YjiG family protein [Clostridioides sp. ZZV15-6597]